MEGDDAAAELIPGTEIEAARLDVRRASQGGVEVPLVEQPPARPTRRPGSFPARARAWTRLTLRWRCAAASSALRSPIVTL